MVHVLLSLCALLLLGASGANAQEQAALDRAIDLWLSGNDQQSLPALAQLAVDGNAEARLLLARIETEDLGPSPFRLGLSSQQARALFRAPGQTKIGRTWLHVEAESGNELAGALRAAKNPTPDPAIIQQLVALGEREATDHPTRILALYGLPDDKRHLRQSPDLLSDLAPYLDYLSQTPEPRGDGLAALRYMIPAKAEQVDPEDAASIGMAGILALGLGFGDSSPGNRWRGDVENWILKAPATRPIADLCTRHCPQDAGACGFAFMALSGGYFEAIRYDTPLESSVPQDLFLGSPRARQMVLRRAVLARTETNQKWLSDLPELAEISQCVVDLTATERLKYN